MKQAYYTNIEQPIMMNNSASMPFPDPGCPPAPINGPLQAAKQQFNCVLAPQGCGLDQYCQRSKAALPTGQKMPKHRFLSPSYYDQPDQQHYDQTSAPFDFQNSTFNNYGKRL